MFQQLLRNANSSKVKTVSISDIAAELNVTGARMVHHNSTGKHYMHLVQADGQYLSIGLGPSVKTEDVGNMKSLIDNYVIFYIETDKEGVLLPNGPVLRFGKQGEFKATELVSVASLFGSKLKENAA